MRPWGRSIGRGDSRRKAARVNVSRANGSRRVTVPFNWLRGGVGRKGDEKNQRAKRGRMAGILIVEDNRDLAAILRELLATEYDVRIAWRGEDAVRMARERTPDLVIMDVQLPGMDGIETSRWIKREMEVPILVLTALAAAGDPEAILASGCCDAYMAKPASLEDIRAKIAELLDKRTRSA